MEIINVTNARQNLFQLISDVNKGFNPINIVNNKGDDAVLVSGDVWRDIEETIYLNSIPGYVDSVNEALKDDMEIVMWKQLKKIRKILTCYETNNVLDEVNRKVEK